MRESREARRLQRGASFIVAFPAVYRDSLAKRETAQWRTRWNKETAVQVSRYRPS